MSDTKQPGGITWDSTREEVLAAVEEHDRRNPRAAGALVDEPTTCLLLWAPIDPSNLDLGFTLRVVHTVEAGSHLRGVACDMQIELLQGGNIFDTLEFTGADEAGDLFQIHVAEETDDQ